LGEITVRWTTGDEPVPATVLVSQVALPARTRRLRHLQEDGLPPEKIVRLDAGAAPISAVVLPEWGYWSAMKGVGRGATTVELACEKIACEKPLAWWHPLIGIHSSDATRGQGIRIGVVDFGLNFGAPAENVTLLDGPEVPDHLRHITHGDHVLSLMSAHADSGAFEGAAPGAHYYFAPASSRIEDECLSPAWIYEQILRLTADWDCHLINLSAGVSTDESGLLEEAVDIAFERGALCVVAAGNTGPDVVYPAKLERALAVGAYGMRGVTPVNSQTAALGDYWAAAESDAGLFMTKFYAFSQEIDVLAPGIGLLPSAGGRVREQSGTSFAAPLATATLAAVLAGDKHYNSVTGNKRSVRALQILANEATSPSGLACCGAELPTIRLPAKGC
jgi:subtilisin family serine protease